MTPETPAGLVARTEKEFAMAFNFEKLDSWQHAVDLAEQVYCLTDEFPQNEKFGLSSQMRRAAISVSSNVADGCSRSSRADFARFVEIATGSVFEIVSQSVLAKRKGLITEREFNHLYAVCETQSRMLSGLRRSLLAN